MTVRRNVTHSATGPITLEDLRVLVNATTDAPPNTMVAVQEHKSFSPTDNQPESISVTYEVMV